MKKKGSLLVVGTGLKAGGHLTAEAQSAIKHADKVFFGEGNPLIVEQIYSLNPNAQTLGDLYGKGKPRTITYAEMVDRILTAVREGLRVCAAFYGHPGVFVHASHKSIRLARAEGYEAQMLPGISAEDCLFADLGIDPAKYGCQTYEASDFLIYRKVFDRRSTLVLWQAGIIGQVDFQGTRYQVTGRDILVEALLEQYPAEHEAIIYEAAQHALLLPRIEPVTIGKLADADLTLISTLVIPPDPKWSTPDKDRVKALGLEDYIKGSKAVKQ